MTENKRFENRLNRDIKKFHALNPVWDNELKDAWNIFEMIDLLNNYDKEYKSCLNDVLRLEKENEQLKQSYKEFEDECQSTFNTMNRKQNDLYRKNFKLKEENEQLKQFKQSVFNLIDKSLEKDKHDYEMTYEDYLNGRIEVLEDLKKELI